MVRHVSPGRIVKGVAVAAVAIIAVVFGANLLGHLVYLPLPWHGQPAIHDTGSLPRSIGTCGRSWSKDATGRSVTFAEASTQGGGITPAVVDPGLLTGCPATACSSWASSPCQTVIFVRVDRDAYIAYALQGGP